MRKIVQIVFICLLLLGTTTTLVAQTTTASDPDVSLKETIYKKYKKEVQAYDKKTFDALFFEFLQKQSDSKLSLTKEEYYTYTIKIAIYSEKLGLLYKDQKEESLKAKKEWFDKSYADYLKSKH